MADTEMQPGDAPGIKLVPKIERLSVPLMQELLVLGRRPSATTSSTEIVGERCSVCSVERPGLEKLHFWVRERSGLAMGCGLSSVREVTSFKQTLHAAGSNVACEGESALPESCPGSTCSGQDWTQRTEEKPKKTQTSPTPSPEGPRAWLTACDPAALPGLSSCGCLHTSSTVSLSLAPSSPEQAAATPSHPCIPPALPANAASTQAVSPRPPIAHPSSQQAQHRVPLPHLGRWPQPAAPGRAAPMVPVGTRDPDACASSNGTRASCLAAREVQNPSEMATVQQQLPLPPAVPLHPPPLRVILPAATLDPAVTPAPSPTLPRGGRQHGCQGTQTLCGAEHNGEGWAAGCPGKFIYRAGWLQTSEETNFNYPRGWGQVLGVLLSFCSLTLELHGSTL